MRVSKRRRTTDIRFYCKCLRSVSSEQKLVYLAGTPLRDSGPQGSSPDPPAGVRIRFLGGAMGSRGSRNLVSIGWGSTAAMWQKAYSRQPLEGTTVSRSRRRQRQPLGSVQARDTRVDGTGVILKYSVSEESFVLARHYPASDSSKGSSWSYSGTGRRAAPLLRNRRTHQCHPHEP